MSKGWALKGRRRPFHASVRSVVCGLASWDGGLGGGGEGTEEGCEMLELQRVVTPERGGHLVGNTGNVAQRLTSRSSV